MSDSPRATNSDLLLKIVTDIAEIKATVKNYADLELRVRDLEKARWSSAWITGLISSVLSAGIIGITLNILKG